MSLSTAASVSGDLRSSRKARQFAVAACMAMSLCAPGVQAAEDQARPDYGPDITLDTAKQLAAGAVGECRQQHWKVAVAIVNTHDLETGFAARRLIAQAFAPDDLLWPEGARPYALATGAP